MPEILSRSIPRLVLLLVAACSFFIACAGEKAPPTGDGPGESHPQADFPGADKILSSLEPAAVVLGEEPWTLEERMKRYRAPALSLAVWHDYEIVWAAAFGLADVEAGKAATPQTLFQAGSISKPVAATAVLAAAQRGDLDLDAPINGLLSSWQLPENELTEKAAVTPRRLLSHTAGTTVHGFPGYAVDAEVPSVQQVLDGEGPTNTAPVRVDLEPGTQYRYSGGGSTIMQLAMTDLTGQPYPALLTSEVLGPMGMSLSTYENPLPPQRLEEAAAGYHRDGKVVWGKRHTYPEMAAAGLWTTPSDLARFAIDLQRALRGDGDTVLSQETVAEMITPVEGRSGLGFFEYESNDALYFGHGGADEGFQALLMASQEGGHGAVLMVNSDNGSRLINEVMPAIARVQGWPGFTSKPIESAPRDAESLEALVGLYEIREHFFYSVTLDGEKLEGRTLLDEEVSGLIPQENGSFISQASGSPLRFELGEGKEVLGYINEQREESGLRRRLGAEELPVVALLDAGRTEEAIERLKVEDISEESLNALGYTLMRYQRAEQAVAVFRLVTERFPQSANAHDSLGDGYQRLGDWAAMAEAFRGVIERVGTDPALEDGGRAEFEKRARSMIELAERRLGAGR